MSPLCPSRFPETWNAHGTTGAGVAILGSEMKAARPGCPRTAIFYRNYRLSDLSQWILGFLYGGLICILLYN